MVTFSHKIMTWKKTIVSTGPFLTETIVESNCQNGTNLYAQYVSWGSISSFAIIYFTWLPWQPLSKLDEIRQIVVLNYYRSEEPFFLCSGFSQRSQMSQYTGHTEHMKIEFFTISPQRKNRNTTNFLLAMPFKIKKTNKVYRLER